MPNFPSLSASSRKGNAAPPGKEVLLKTPSSAAHQAKGPPPVSDREAREAARLAKKDENEINAALEVVVVVVTRGAGPPLAGLCQILSSLNQEMSKLLLNRASVRRWREI